MLMKAMSKADKQIKQESWVISRNCEI